jgi:hypothetical protein
MISVKDLRAILNEYTGPDTELLYVSVGRVTMFGMGPRTVGKGRFSIGKDIYSFTEILSENGGNWTHTGQYKIVKEGQV